ncbi:hypothetical protein GOODEAATRI_002163 [Goodea atripinnis]|uniref:Uncharacterized protein n=1 Tax=Goodea atripinnis TaxID=208336 RepID=A0ABV0PK52_9TELE
MPNLAPRTSLRSLEAVRNSRSMEANLQSSGNRMSHLTRSPSTGMACSRLRSNGQSPLTLRTPVKAVNPVGSMSAGRQSPRGLPVIQSLPTTGGRRVQSPGSVNGGGYIPGRASFGGGRPVVGRAQAVSSVSTRSKLSQPPRREQADWPRPSKEWPGIQKLQAALSLPSKINQNNNRHIRQGGDTPIESGDEAIRVIILMEQGT